MKINEILTENYNGEYDDEAGMAQTNLRTIARAAQGLLDTIDDQENLPEWVQEKIAKVEGMMVTAWDYLLSQEEQGMDPRMMEAKSAHPQQAATAIAMKKAGKKPKSQINELAPDAGGGGSGNYFQALASAWYNHDISMLADIARKGGSPLKKITDAQEAVEKMLQRGVIGSDGKTRKYDITYNSDFDGVVIQSKDYYEYSDYDAAGNEVDSRNGRPWGPNDYMEFGGDDLDEGMYEASPELTEEFDLIESIIERLAEHNGVDAEVIWEDLETLTEDELYAFAVTSEPIMESQGMAEGAAPGKVADIKGQIAELEAEQEQNEFGSYAYDTVDGELQYLYAKLDKAEKGVAEGLEWETRHDEFTTVGDRATPEQINKIVSALGVAAKQASSKRGFLNQIAGKQSNGDLARMAQGAETLAKNIQRNSNAKPGTDERKELGQHLVYAVSLLKRMNGEQGVAEDWQKANKRDRTAGMSQKAVNAYRRENPGSKLKTAVTTKPSKLKRGSKASKRRKSYCSRSRGQMKMHSISCAKTPDKAICKARRRWNC